MHALIIEDEILIALSIEHCLRELRYLTFEFVANANDAIAAAERQCPDLIIADHRIIGGTGTDAVMAICSDRTIPVVFVTGSGPEVRDRLPDAFIVAKPFTMSHLHAAVSMAIEQPFRHSPDGPQALPGAD